MSDGDPDSDVDPLPLMPDEPADFRPPPPAPTTTTHTLTTAPYETLTLRLVGHNPLWGHHLWNAAVVLAGYLEQHTALFCAGRVLELGAGAGLPSLVCALRGAAEVVITDYPDAPLIANLRTNIAAAPLPTHGGGGHAGGATPPTHVRAEGYVWGNSPVPAHDCDLLILSDLLFNHSEHDKLVRTVLQALKPAAGRALVFFSPHRPWLLSADLAFFERCEQAGLRVELIVQHLCPRPMFEDDRGDRDLRRTVFGYTVWRD